MVDSLIAARRNLVDPIEQASFVIDGGFWRQGDLLARNLYKMMDYKTDQSRLQIIMQ